MKYEYHLTFQYTLVLTVLLLIHKLSSLAVNQDVINAQKTFLGPAVYTQDDSQELKQAPQTFLGPPVYAREEDLKLSSTQCILADEDQRFDCWPGLGTTQEACEKRGCCWAVSNHDRESSDVRRNASLGRVVDTPFCYFPLNYPTYQISSGPSVTRYGWTADLQRFTPSPWPNDVMKLRIDVFFETETRLRFKIYDPNKKRYEVPIATSKIDRATSKRDYDIKFTSNPFSFSVYRKSTSALLFSSDIDSAPLIFADQFIQISTRVGGESFYGLGEHMSPLKQPLTRHQENMWARDAPPQPGKNLYGSHPFYMALEPITNKAHGVFLLNSNAMDVDVQPLPALTYRTIGGILDFYVFTGPSPDAVVQQYTELIGYTFMPPYWSFGFHLCKYGYSSSAEVQQVIDRNRAIQIPYDTQWTDIDYMEAFKDWTYDKKAFATLPQVVADLKQHQQHYIIIVDPCISSTQPAGTYFPWDDGVRSDIFIKNATNQILIAKVWPGNCAFPDFTNSKSLDYWYRSAKKFHDQIPFDSLWTDMNEPSNFGEGSVDGCEQSSLNNPPYTPGVNGESIVTKTICPSSKQSAGLHYDVHNLFGLSETIQTHAVLKKIRGKRSIVISRSTFPSSGRYTGHWTGDIVSTWDYLYYSIPAMLEFQMYGVPFVGADICGFSGDTTEELCTRWMQLGAFYPFMRNHANLGSKDQDPAVFSKQAQDSMRDVLNIRYSLLPYLYTLFYFSNQAGVAVVRPLFFQYPDDVATRPIDRQFFWGDALLVSPVLTEGATTVDAYFPNDTFYDFRTGERVMNVAKYNELNAPLSTIPLHTRGGSVIPTQKPEITTVAARKNPLGFLVSLSTAGTAFGVLYQDDGESLDPVEKKIFNLIKISANSTSLRTSVAIGGYTAPVGTSLSNITVYGLNRGPTKPVTVNGVKVSYSFNSSTKVLSISGFNTSLLKTIEASWA